MMNYKIDFHYYLAYHTKKRNDAQKLSKNGATKPVAL